MTRKFKIIFKLFIFLIANSMHAECSSLKLFKQNEITIIKGQLFYFADSSAMPGARILVNTDKEYFSAEDGSFEAVLNLSHIDSVKIECIGCRSVTFINIPHEKVIDLNSILLFEKVESLPVVYADIHWWQFVRKKKVSQAALSERNMQIENVKRSLATYTYTFNNQEYIYDLSTNKIDLANPAKAN